MPFFDEVVHISFRGAEAGSCGPTVCRTTEVPLLLGTVVDVPVVQVVRVPPCPDPPIAVRCVAMSCGGESFSPDGVYDYAWDSVKPMKGKYTINYIQYPCRRWVCLHAE